MAHDFIDRVIERWQAECPSLDSRSLGVVGRVLRLAGHLERRANESLKEFDLPLWAFDVLATLRRRGKPYCMTPGELMQSVMLSSGAMTHRIDRLEALELIERSPDPQDRRSLKVRLTAKGLKLIEAAAPVRFRESQAALQGLSAHEKQQLSTLLRQLLHNLEQR